MSTIAAKWSKYKVPILYSGGSVVKSFAQMIAGLVVAKFVTPEDFGLWNTLNLALVYSLVLQSGLINGMNRELPYLFGKGEDKDAISMAGTAQTVTLIVSLIVLIAGAVYVLFSHESDERIRYGVMGMALLIALNYYQSYLFSTFRSRDSFLKLSKIQFLHAFVNLATIVLVVYWSYYGLVVKAIILSLIYVAAMHFLRPIKVGLIWDKIAFIQLLKVGLPIFILGYIESISMTVDRMLLLHYGTFTEVGLYAFAFFALTSLNIIPTSIASYIYPKMTYEYGKTHDRMLMWKYVVKITTILLVALIPLTVTGYFICPALVNHFFPEYNGSIAPMKVLLFAGIFSGATIGVNVLWSMKIWKSMIAYQLLFSLFLIIFPLIGAHLFSSRTLGIAFGVLTAHVLNWFSAMTFCYFATHKHTKHV